MTGEATTTDREALLRIRRAGGVDVAATILADFLAQHDKATAARTLREAADDLPDHLVAVDDWLRDRADRIEATP